MTGPLPMGRGNPPILFLMGFRFFRMWVRPNVATASPGTGLCCPENSDRAYAGLSMEREV